jgi:hypothetical protein
MRQLFIFILLTFLFSDSFAQVGYSLSVSDTLQYQFQADEYAYNVFIGSINYGQRPIDYTFYVRNNSDTPLVIKQANWAEPILAPSYSKEPILKGQTGVIKYTLLETRRPGPFSKSASVETNQGRFHINFIGTNLPPSLYIDTPLKIDSVALGDTLSYEYKIYNTSDSTSFKIESIQSGWKTLISYDQDEVRKYENTLPPHSYRTVKVLFVPYQIGVCSSKIIIKLSDIGEKMKREYNWKTIEHKLFTNVR